MSERPAVACNYACDRPLATAISKKTRRSSAFAHLVEPPVQEISDGRLGDDFATLLYAEADTECGARQSGAAVLVRKGNPT
jgi:hypothetical protein